MSFFTYPIYDIPDASEATLVSLNKPVSIFVNESQYDETAATLLSKVLGSVGQSVEDADIHKLPGGADLKIKSNSEQHLIISFGFSPKTFSLQIDSTLYKLIPLKEKMFLFSKPLSELPEFPQDKRALWIALKEYFKIP